MDAPNAHFDLQHLLSPATLYQILVGSAVVTTAINITWFFISLFLNRIAARIRLRVKSHNFILGEGMTREEYEKLSLQISAFYCLLVRFGTDDYISKMANDQERYEGRQRLKLCRISVIFDKNDRAIFNLKLPIHKSLGTQFKCFAVARSLAQVPAVIEMLKKCEHASDIKQSDSYHRGRVYFLLDQFSIVDTFHLGVKNNYIFPE